MLDLRPRLLGLPLCLAKRAVAGDGYQQNFTLRRGQMLTYYQVLPEDNKLNFKGEDVPGFVCHPACLPAQPGYGPGVELSKCFGQGFRLVVTDGPVRDNLQG